MYKVDIFFKLKDSICNTPLVKSFLLYSDNTNPEGQRRINKLVADQLSERKLIDEKHLIYDIRKVQKDACMETLKKLNRYIQ